MVNLILNGIGIFLFVFSILIIIKNLFNFIKVLYLKEGKYDNSRIQQLLLGSSISYVITFLIL